MTDNYPPRDDEIDSSTPSGARMYDYILGGTDNYPVDRIATERGEDKYPGILAAVRNNRRYLERVVRFLVGDCGIRQFIDNGSGLPTQNNVHQIAQRINPACKVVYIDNDPVVLRHQKVNALAENKNTAFVLSDARNVEQILNHPEMTRLIDFGEPAAALYLSFLHFIPDKDDPEGMVRRMTDSLAPGSYLAVSHLASDDPEVRHWLSNYLQQTLGSGFGRCKEKQDVGAFFDGLELVEPGLVSVADWRPDGREEEQTAMVTEFGGVGRKP